MNVVSMTKTIHLLAKKKTTLEIISFSMTMKDQETCIFNNSAASFTSNRSQREYLDENHDQRHAGIEWVATSHFCGQGVLRNTGTMMVESKAPGI